MAYILLLTCIFLKKNSLLRNVNQIFVNTHLYPVLPETGINILAPQHWGTICGSETQITQVDTCHSSVWSAVGRRQWSPAPGKRWSCCLQRKYKVMSDMQWYIHPHLVPITVCKGADPYPAYPDHIFSDPGWQKVGSVIRDNHPGSATLIFFNCGSRIPRSGVGWPKIGQNLQGSRSATLTVWIRFYFFSCTYQCKWARTWSAALREWRRRPSWHTAQ